MHKEVQRDMLPVVTSASTVTSIIYTYRIMQIVRGGKVLRLHDLVIRRKTFAIV